jgi:hypothetical protein
MDLVERFESNQESLQIQALQRDSIQKEFANPFFKALGWDIDNEQGFSEECDVQSNLEK